jgi:hypothetical protein
VIAIRVLAALLSLTWAAHAEPIVILTTGQSNVVYRVVQAWEPSPNALRWDWDGNDGHVGSMFRPLLDSSITLSDRIASELAAPRVGPVFSISIGFFAKSIAHWLPGSPAPDVFANIRANVPLALALAGVKKIDYLFWWQGETPTDKPDLYADHFDAVMARFQGEPWFPRTTPVMVFGLAPSHVSRSGFADYYNTLLQEAVAREPSTRRFLSSYDLDDTYWRDVGHPNGRGFLEIGTRAAERAAIGLVAKTPTAH